MCLESVSFVLYTLHSSEASLSSISSCVVVRFQNSYLKSIQKNLKEKSFPRFTQSGSCTYLWTNFCDWGDQGMVVVVNPAQTTWMQSDMVLNGVRKKKIIIIMIMIVTNFFFFSYLFFFLGPHLQHIKVPRLGIKLELQLPVYTTDSNAGFNLCLQPTP